ncbi:MAG: hypothetical protein ACRDL7_12310 [Gaiellaceae bacterium]
MKQGCQQCWVYKMLQVASLLDLVASNVTTLPKVDILQLQFNYKDVKAAAQQFFDKVWRELHPDPRTAPADEVLFSTYEVWIHCPQHQAKHLSTYLSWKYRMLLLRYRFGGHDLQIERGRFQQQDRYQRLCQCCSLGTVEDLKHFVLDCPAYQEIRQEFACIFTVADGFMPKIFNYSDTWIVCQMLEKMEAHRLYLVPNKKKLRINRVIGRRTNL